MAALALGAQATAQEDSSAAPPADQAAQPSGIASMQFSGFERGDGILSLSLGAVFPLGFYNPTTAAFQVANSYPGFSFALSYAGFLSDKWALAGDLAGGFIGTINGDRLFVAPLALRAIRAFTLGSFVIAPTAGLGVSISSLGTDKKVDPLLKLGSSFLWKASSDMSYGLNLYGNIIPQLYTTYPENNRVAFFLDATLSVAYHL